jgi:hypothetical protein
MKNSRATATEDHHACSKRRKNFDGDGYDSIDLPKHYKLVRVAFQTVILRPGLHFMKQVVRSYQDAYNACAS